MRLFRDWIVAAALACGFGVPTFASDFEIRGRAVDDQGVGVAGAVVEIYAWAGSFEEDLRFLGPDAAATPLKKVRSDSEGFFELEAPAGQCLLLRLRTRGTRSMETFLAHRFDEVDLRPVTLPAATRLEVRVVSAGKPVAGAWVGTARRHLLSDGWRVSPLRAQTDAEGTAAIWIQNEAKYGRIYGFAPGVGSASSPPPKSESVTLELSSPGGRTIEVRDDRGRPVAGALVRVGQGAWPAGRSDDQGRFLVYPPADSGPGSGGLQVAVETADGHYGTRRLRAAKTDEEPVVIELEPLAALSGRVFDTRTDRPLAGARVWLETDPSRFVDSGRDGSYRLGVQAERWQVARLRAAAPGYLGNDDEGSGYGPPRGRRDVALLPAAFLGGRVVDADGQPIEGAEVTGQTSRRPSVASFAYSRTDGRFQITIADNVLYQVAASKTGFLAAHQEAAAESGRPKEDIEFVLRPGLPGSGLVVDAGGRPISGAEIQLSAPGPETHLLQMRGHRTEPLHRTTSDAEGRFTVGNLEPGRLDLSATARGYAETVVRGLEAIAGGDGTVDLGTVILESGVRLEGRVVDPDGQPLAEAVVKWLRWPAGRGARGFSGMTELAEVSSDPDGRFVIEDLGAGAKWTLEARLRGYTEAQVDGVEAPASEPVVLVLTPKGSLRGTVVDDRGEPVPEAHVSVMHEREGGGSHGSQLRCDADGRFEVEVDAPSRVQVSASLEELRSEPTTLEVTAGQVIEDLRLVMVPGAAVEGLVLGPSGEPIEGAEVRYYGGRLFTRFGQPPLSDDQGRFRLGGLEPGLLHITVSAKGFASVDRQVDVRAGKTQSVEIRLREGREVRGRVVDEQLAPIGGAQVSLSGGGGSDRGVSDADGSFALRVPDGSYQLRAFKQGFVEAVLAEKVEVASEPILGLEIQLSKGGAIVGRILGIEPDRFRDLQVTAGSRYRAQAVDHQGGYRIEPLPPGDWEVVASEMSSGRQARGRAVLGPGVEEVALDLEFFDGLALSGRVLVDGVPEPSAVIQVHGLDVRAARHTAVDYRGRFRLADLELGRYQLEARKDSIVERRELELTADLEVEIEIDTYSLSGRVVDDDDERPLAGTQIQLEPAAGEPSPMYWPPAVATDERGRFQFQRLAEGDYSLRASLQDYASSRRRLALTEGADLENLELRLQRTEGLHLEVHLAAGGAPGHVRVAALDGAGEAVVNGHFRIEEDGRVHLTTLPAGSWQLLVAAPASGIVRLTAQAPGPPMSVLLPPATRLEIQVPDLVAGRRLATLRVSRPDGKPFLAFDHRSIRLIREWPVYQGRANVGALPPGPWNLSVTGTGEGEAWSTSFVAPAEGGEVRLEVR